MSNVEVEALKNLRSSASEAYYLGDPIISDAEFDALTKRLEAAGVEEEVGHGYVPADPTTTIRHQYPLLSLTKVREVEEIAKWTNKYTLFPNYVIQPKYDGLALDITFTEDGELISAATRGDGRVGENVTHTVRSMMKSGRLPDKISSEGFSGNTHVLGEVFITHGDLEALNASQTDREYSNPRNAAAGLLRRKSVDLSRFLSFVAYDSNHYDADEVDFLEGNGFTTPKDHFYAVARSVNDITAAIEKISELRDSTFDFDIDGVVIKLKGSRLQREEIGNSSSAPRWAVAYKYPNVYSQTDIQDVKWNVTRTGRLVPVAIFDEVLLAGNAKTTRATLHNYAQFVVHSLAKGDTIEITRAGEVIPYVVGKVGESLEGAVKFDYPKFFPTEEFPTRFNGTGLDLLVHKDAPVNTAASIEYSLKALDVKGIGPSLIEELLLAGKIENFLDLLNITESDILSARGIVLKNGATSKSATNAVNAAKTAFQQPLWRWIAAIGMRFIANNKSPILEARYDSLDALAQATTAEIAKLEGFGGEKTASVIASSATIQEWADRLRTEHNFVPKPEEKVEVVASKGDVDYSGKKVVVTGTFPTMKRGDVESWVKAHGGKISSSVSSSTDILVAGEKAGTKLAKAESLGTVQIISAQQFEDDI